MAENQSFEALCTKKFTSNFDVSLKVIIDVTAIDDPKLNTSYINFFSRYDCRKTPSDGIPGKPRSGLSDRDRLPNTDPYNDDKETG